MDIKLNKKLIRKIGGFALTTTLALSLAACGGKKDEDSSQQVEKNEIVVEKKKDDKTTKKKNKSKTNEITFSEYFNQDKPVIIYNEDPLKDSKPYRIIKNNKVKILSRELSSKSLDDFSKMTEDEILSYFGKRTPQKSYDELSDSDKEIVDKFQKKYKNSESFHDSLDLELNKKIDHYYYSDSAVNLTRNGDDVSEAVDKLSKDYNIDINNALSTNEGVLNDVLIHLEYAGVDGLTLGYFINTPVHTVEYNVEKFKESVETALKEYEEENGHEIDDEGKKLFDILENGLRNYLEIYLNETNVEQDINEILDILYDGDELNMDDGYDIVYSVKTGSSDSNSKEVVNEKIYYINDYGELKYIPLYDEKSSELINLGEKTYLDSKFGIVEIPEKMNLVYDDVNSKGILVNKDEIEIKEVLEAK